MSTLRTAPAVPKTADELLAAINDVLATVSDSDAAIGDARDGYSKSAEAMWMVGYIAHEYAAAAVGATSFQHGFSRLMLLSMLAGGEGPYMVLDGQNALYPQYDLPGQVRDWMESDSFRAWAAQEARELLAQRQGAHPNVVAHWEQLAAYVPSGEEN